MQARHKTRVLTAAPATTTLAATLHAVRPPKKRVKRQFIRTRAVFGTHELAIHIGMRTRNPENGGNMHWGAKAAQKKKFTNSVIGVDRPLAVTRITFTRWAPGTFDDDGLVASFKWFRDAACAWLGLPNDSPTCGVTFTYEQFKNPAYGITVRFS